VVVGVVNSLRAQAPATDTKRPAFEVASVKPNKSHSPGGTLGFQPGGRFSAINVSVQMLVAVTFGPDRRPLAPFQIAGGPDWIKSDGFDITAKTESNSPQEVTGASKQMIRSLLEDRFALKAHMETRQLPVYALVMARTDGKLGPQLRQSVLDCAGRGATVRLGTSQPAAPTACGMRFGTGSFSAGGITMTSLVTALNVDRLVLDRSGLTGSFDVELQWTVERSLGGATDSATNAGAPPDAPSIFTAVQEQLGLKLESTKAPVDVLVIDHVEQPTPD
jgi:uncharacterized protein (TIGR03435 family)